MMFDMFPRLMIMGMGMLIVTVILLTFLFAVVVVLKGLANRNHSNVVMDDYDEGKRKHDRLTDYNFDDDELHYAEIIEEDQHQAGA